MSTTTAARARATHARPGDLARLSPRDALAYLSGRTVHHGALALRYTPATAAKAWGKANGWTGRRGGKVDGPHGQSLPGWSVVHDANAAAILAHNAALCTRLGAYAIRAREHPADALDVDATPAARRAVADAFPTVRQREAQRELQPEPHRIAPPRLAIGGDGHATAHGDGAATGRDLPTVAIPHPPTLPHERDGRPHGPTPATLGALMHETRLQPTGLEHAAEPLDLDPVLSPHQAAALLRPYYETIDVEEILLLCLNHARRPLCVVRLGRGGESSCAVSVPGIARAAILSRASAVVLAHNHPGGSTEPSANDDDLTRTAKRALDAVGVPLNDHVIVTSRTHYSYSHNGRL